MPTSPPAELGISAFMDLFRQRIKDNNFYGTNRGKYAKNRRMAESNVSTADVYSVEAIRQVISNCLGPDRVPAKFRIVTDTTDFFRVDYNDVAVLNGVPYLIRRCEREGRFGLDDEPKYWVKRAIDLRDGSTKIIKLVFYEHLSARVGDIVFECVRSPQKEAVILDLVRGHKYFMQGFAVRDAANNIIRVLDYITGRRLDDHIYKLYTTHEEYYYTQVPELLKNYIDLIGAIQFLHSHGYKHGDIRRDHILKEAETGIYKWIDFDYDYLHESNMFGYDIFGLGNILIYIVGGKDITTQLLNSEDPATLERLNQDDMNIIFNNRLANLRKVYPYINEALNTVLLHFANGANIFYDTTGQLLDDLREIIIN
jgi:hypothetical protein